MKQVSFDVAWATTRAAPSPRAEAELVVDLFCGGGGFSEGVRLATGRAPDAAVDHDERAIATHAANHTLTRHYCADVFAVDPRAVCGGRPLGLLTMSPSCTHFSQARSPGALDEGIRSLADVAHLWVERARPRVLILENVPAFQRWGPLLDDHKPDPARVGESFRAWVARLVERGYAVEWRVLSAADFGAPTTRKRLFVLARCDGAPIVWPEPTHGADHQPASGIIDWTRLPPSIFARAKPHAESTLRRIADGTRRYAIETSRPYLAGDASYFITKHFSGVVGHDLHRPLGTVTTRDHHSLTVAYTDGPEDRRAQVAAHCLIHRGNGERTGQRPPSMSVDAPLTTVVACGVRQGLVSATLAGPDDRREQVAAFLERYAPGVRPVVMVDGEPREIIDLGMRMLTPRELAAAQSFPAGYALPGGTTAAIAHVGNAVPPLLAAAIVGANYACRAG